MSEYVLKKIEAIKDSKYNFFQLEVDGTCQLNDFENEIKNNKQYTSEFTTLIAYAQHYADGKIIPEKKINVIKTHLKEVNVNEFKSKHLRIYFFFFDNNPDRIITLCGYKNQQKRDVIKLMGIIQRFIKQ